jgi:hypothetical protein
MAPKTAAERTHAKSTFAAPGSVTQGGLHINEATGLCTDYLNRFNEAVMLLELLPSVPDSIEDFLAWRPCSYAEHFANSNFKNRDAVIAAYKAADPATRKALDGLADTMNVLLLATRDAMKHDTKMGSAETLAQAALAWVKPLVTRAGFVINGVRVEEARTTGVSAAQAAVDALFAN